MRAVLRAWVPALVAVASGVSPAAELRVATYNTQGLGAAGSPGYLAQVDILRRIDADVVMLQEVNPPEIGLVDDLAADAGYASSCVSDISGTLSGGLHTAALSRLPLTQCLSWSAQELSGDPAANDITRDVFEVHVAVAPGEATWGVFTLHLKAGGTDTDKFRRQVELVRVTQALNRFRFLHAGSPIVVTGDWNEDIGNGPFGAPTFLMLPPGLPGSYELGADIAFPVVYDPFVTLEANGLTILHAFHEDDPLDDVTHWPTGLHLDYLAVDRHAEALGTEIYDACDDNGVDDPPPGYDLPKAGRPLPCGVEAVASDHLAVFGDIVRLAVDQDGDGLDDATDCAPLDGDAGVPAPISALAASKLPGGGVRWTWSAAATADQYDLIGGGLPADDVPAADCRTAEDSDSTDTQFDDAVPPAPGTGDWLLVRGVDLGCGGAGTYGSGDPAGDPTNDACPLPSE
jgi:endonuclease/exonuclease/phosphatase family metal-dependent hydrolase